VNILDDIAPFPSGHKVSAKGMATHYAALSLIHHTLTMDHIDFLKQREAYNKSANMAILSYAVAHLLNALAEIGPQGEQEALELWQDLGDPPGFGPSLWAWLTDAGVDPQAVIELAEQAATPNPAAGTQAGMGGAA
jgi:hypothetical protein